MLSKLLNKKFHSISRAVDMLCIQIGNDFPTVSLKGERKNISEYSLHFQTQWRFRDDAQILLASCDIYEPYSNAVPENWEYDIIGRPDELSSVFDVRAKVLSMKLCGATVTEAFLSCVNDITICFSNGIVFEQFMSATRKDEEWRFIDYQNNLHLVCYDEHGNCSCE